MLVNTRMERWTVAYLYSAIKRANYYDRMNLNIKEKKPDAKEYLLCDSI